MNEVYRVLVAEDEPALLRHICQKIAGFGDGYRLVGAAENGQQALELARKYRPDIVVTDILMPLLDGLALLRAMQGEGMLFEAVLMSGYDDFSYAREAMHLGVSEYLLKPVSGAALQKALQKAGQELDQARRQRMADLLLSLRSPQARIQDAPLRFQAYLLCFGNRCSGGVQRVDALSAARPIPGLLQLPEEDVWLLPEQNGNECLLILCGNPRSPEATAGAIADTDPSVHVTILHRALRQEDLSEAAEQLRRAEDEQLVPWRPGILRASQDSIPAADPTLSLKEKEQISACLLAGKAGALHQLLKRILEARWREGLSQRLFERLVVRVLDACFSLCDRSIDQAQRAAAIQDCITLIAAADSFDAFSDALFIRIRPLLFEAEATLSGREGAALRVRQYLQEHYMEQVSLSSLAALAGMDPASFTKVFRSCCGEPPMKYLISLRIDAAGKLLEEHPMLGVRTVGEMVGYPDPFHFSKTFKKITGLSPSEYREKKA